MEPGLDGRILDRLAGLEKVIAPELVAKVLAKVGAVNGRACKLTHEVMTWVVLAMGLLTNMPIRQVFKHSRRLREDEDWPCRSSLCEARKRLGVEPLRQLHAEVVRPLATLADTPEAFYRGLRLMAIDGAIMDVPDTPVNDKAFGRSSSGRGEAAFPQARKVSLVELGTHIETALAIGGWKDAEQTLAPELWDQIPTDALLIEDRGLFSYPDWQALNSRTKLLIRVKSNQILKSIQRLSDNTNLSKIYARSDDRARDRNGIVVRVIEYTLDDPQRTGHGERHRLITNLLDEAQYPGMELISLYHERWEHEMTYDEQKTHQDPRRAEKPAQLRSETPEGVKQELYALSLGHFVVRSMMVQAAAPEKLDVDRLSFTNCFRILTCRLPECDTSTPTSFQRWYQLVLAEMRGEQNEPRRNRINPRVIKRKMSRWPKKRAIHRKQPPLRKAFMESVVMTI